MNIRYLAVAAVLLLPTPAFAEAFDCTVRSIEEWRSDIPNGVNDALAQSGQFRLLMDLEAGQVLAVEGNTPMGPVDIFEVDERGEGANAEVILINDKDGILLRVHRQTLSFAQINSVSVLTGDCVSDKQ